MNTLEMTDVAIKEADIESASIRFAAQQQPATKIKSDARPRYVLLVVIALFLASLTFITLDSINTINAQLDMIRANELKPTSMTH